MTKQVRDRLDLEAVSEPITPGQRYSVGPDRAWKIRADGVPLARRDRHREGSETAPKLNRVLCSSADISRRPFSIFHLPFAIPPGGRETAGRGGGTKGL